MQIIFSTFNARYSHTSLALRCLRANLGPLRDQSEILEFDIRLSPQSAAEKLLVRAPDLLFFSVYIWNLTVITETVAVLRAIRPNLKIVVGGPEAAHEYEHTALFKQVNHLIRGEGEAVIESICQTLLKQGRQDACDTAPQASSLPCLPEVIEAPPADLTTRALPYAEYTDDDIAHRRIYVESSRGCPFSCDYCLSSLEHGVRTIPLERLLPMLETLIERGARIFKFIDRSFNASPDHAARILRFFLEHRRDNMMLHLEWEPHLMPNKLETILRNAPPGFFQLETGVQSFTPAVAQRVRRRLNADLVEKNIRLLSALPSVHLHADLIAGLPGETMPSLAKSFDRLHACDPNEIQLGILKKLRGAPIARHDDPFQMVYNTAPPYDVLQTSTLTFPELQAVRRFARFWDITVNNGRFPNSAPMIWENASSVFTAFMEWSHWLYEQTYAVFGFTPARLGRFLMQFCTEKRGLPAPRVEQQVAHDLNACLTGRKGLERQTRRTP